MFLCSIASAVLSATAVLAAAGTGVVLAAAAAACYVLAAVAAATVVVVTAAAALPTSVVGLRLVRWLGRVLVVRDGGCRTGPRL